MDSGALYIVPILLLRVALGEHHLETLESPKFSDEGDILIVFGTRCRGPPRGLFKVNWEDGASMELLGEVRSSHRKLRVSFKG